MLWGAVGCKYNYINNNVSTPSTSCMRGYMLPHLLGFAAEVPPQQRLLLSQGKEQHHSWGGKGSQRCVWGVPCSSHTLSQAEPGYLGYKTLQNVEIAVLSVSMAQGGGKLCKAPQLLSSVFYVLRTFCCSLCCSCHLCLEWWHGSLSPWSRAGCLCPGARSPPCLGREAQPGVSPARLLLCSGCSCSLPAVMCCVWASAQSLQHPRAGHMWGAPAPPVCCDSVPEARPALRQNLQVQLLQ